MNKHNEWIFKLTSQFPSSPTNDRLEKLRVLEENLKVSAKQFLVDLKSFLILKSQLLINIIEIPINIRNLKQIRNN